MASSWPGAIDSFPTNVDYVEYIEAALMNNVQNSIVALQEGLGSGTGTSLNNPLYSPVFNQTFATITARLVNVEEDSAGGLQLDHSTGDIQPLGTAAAAGSVGKAADSGHRHAGLNTVLGNILPVGNTTGGSQGSSGLAADAQHIHPFTIYQWQGSYEGTPPQPGTGGFAIQAGTYVGLTNSDGGGAVTFTDPFPGGLLTVIVCPGDNNLNGINGYSANNTVTVIGGQATTTGFGFQFTSGGLVVNTEEVRVNWLAIGW
jgi:hypothetical protein